MQRSLASLLVLAISLHGAAARADDPLPNVSGVCAPEVQIRRALISHEGHPGVWFELEVARCMLSRLSSLPLYAERVSLLERRLQLSDERHDTMQRALSISFDIEAQYESALSSALERARDAEAASHKWYRAPGLWFALGMVVSGALIALAAYGWSQTH